MSLQKIKVLSVEPAPFHDKSANLWKANIQIMARGKYIKTYVLWAGENPNAVIRDLENLKRNKK